MTHHLFAAVLLHLTLATAFLIAACLTVPNFGADFTVRVKRNRLATVSRAKFVTVFPGFFVLVTACLLNLFGALKLLFILL
jgi:hypothetical protein